MFSKNEKNNLIMDFYEFALANGFVKEGIEETTAWFDVFFRPSQPIGGFCIMAGVEQLCEILSNLSFDDDDIDFLREKGISDEFLDYLKNFEFKCDIWAVPEGTPVLQANLLLRSKGPFFRHFLLKQCCC